jgi:hypothetical protein
MKGLGKMMAAHLHSTHGAGEYAEFAEGFLEGGGFFDDFASGFKKGFEGVMKVAKPVLGVIPHPAAQAASSALGAVGFGKLTIEHGEESEVEGCGKLTIHHGGMGTGAYEGKGKKTRKAAGPNDKRRARAAVVKKVMQERGCGLGEASKIVKQEKLF